MTHASLFSGIGGAELAATWMGWTNLFHCEIDPFCLRVLEYWYPNSKSYDNIKTTDFTPWRGRVDILTGGFPCQPFSLAGRRAGTQDDRYLWPQMLRAISDIRPTWVVGENVAGLITMVQPGSETVMGKTDNIFEESYLCRKEQHYVLFDIISSLEKVGYAVQAFVIPACAVGAPHRRDRIWIVAHRTDARLENQQKREVVASSTWHTSHADSSGRGKRHNSLQSDISDGKGSESNGIEWNASHTDCDRFRFRPGQPVTQQGIEVPSDACRTREAGITSGITADARGNGRYAFTYGDGHTESAQQAQVKPFGADRPQDWWRDFPSVPPVCGGDDGLPFDLSRLAISEPRWRREAIKALGNAWVPQIAYEIFRAINKINEYETENSFYGEEPQ